MNSVTYSKDMPEGFRLRITYIAEAFNRGHLQITASVAPHNEPAHYLNLNKKGGVDRHSKQDEAAREEAKRIVEELEEKNCRNKKAPKAFNGPAMIYALEHDAFRVQPVVEKILEGDGYSLFYARTDAEIAREAAIARVREVLKPAVRPTLLDELTEKVATAYEGKSPGVGMAKG